MNRINAIPWDTLAERNRWTWLGHIARGRGYPRLILDALDRTQINTITSDLKWKYAMDWKLKAARVDRFKWRELFDTYMPSPPMQNISFRSIISTRRHSRDADVVRV